MRVGRSGYRKGKGIREVTVVVVTTGFQFWLATTGSLSGAP
jgi:hypothetical protein